MCQLFLFFLIFSAFIFFHHQSNLAQQIGENVNELENNINPPVHYGKNSELIHSRKKRFFDPITWSLSTILMLVIWNGFLAPFLQAQISLKISIFGWFDDEGCLKRVWKNNFKSYCKPTIEQMYINEFIHQNYMIIFNNISPETADLLQYEHSRIVQINEPPTNPKYSLSERESLFLILFKNRLLPYGHVKIPKWLLADEDKNSQKLYEHFYRVWSKLPDEKECEENINYWKEKKKNGKEILESDFHILLKCECVRMQGDWTMANRPITVETVKNCLELLELKKVLPEKEQENINAKINDEIEDREEIFYSALIEQPEEKKLIEKIAEEIKGVRRINVNNMEEIVDEEKLRKINEEKKKQQIRRTNLKKILSDFLSNFDVKEQIEFLQRLEQNLLELEERKKKPFPASSSSCFSKISSVISSQSNSLDSRNEEEINLSSAYGENLEEEKFEEGQCQITYEDYGKNCLIDWKRNDSEHLYLRKEKDEFGNAGMEFYPKNFITLFEKTFELAKEQFEQKILNISSKIKEHIGKKHLLIIFRRISCRIYEFAKEKYMEEKKNDKLKFFKKINIFSNKKKKNGRFQMAKDVLKKFSKLCKKFYERNLKERTELLAIEGYEELDKNGQLIIDKIFNKIEINDLHAEIEDQNSEVDNNAAISPDNSEKSQQISPEKFKISKKNFVRYINKKLSGIGIRSKRSNKYFAENGGEENKIGINKTGGLIRRKRLTIALTLLGFTASLIFLQVYLRFFIKKYDPIFWLWMCMKYPRSRCKVPAAIQNENEFIEIAKENARVEMLAKTVVKMRKLFELSLPFLLRIKKLKKILMWPSQFFAKYSIKLNRRYQILLDCYYYDWKRSEKKPKNLDNLLAPIIEANKKNCILFTEFMKNQIIPQGLKHILTHCSQIGGNV